MRLHSFTVELDYISLFFFRRSFFLSFYSLNSTNFTGVGHIAIKSFRVKSIANCITVFFNISETVFVSEKNNYTMNISRKPRLAAISAFVLSIIAPDEIAKHAPIVIATVMINFNAIILTPPADLLYQTTVETMMRPTGRRL